MCLFQQTCLCLSGYVPALCAALHPSMATTDQSKGKNIIICKKISLKKQTQHSLFEKNRIVVVFRPPRLGGEELS